MLDTASLIFLSEGCLVSNLFTLTDGDVLFPILWLIYFRGLPDHIAFCTWADDMVQDALRL